MTSGSAPQAPKPSAARGPERPEALIAFGNKTAVAVWDTLLRIGARRKLLDFYDSTPSFQPMVEAALANPKRVLNPMDWSFELFRPDYFKKTRFDAPMGDPGWFGPDSAIWYVLTHTPTISLGLLNTAIVDIMHQDIQYAVFDHSKLVGRDKETGRVLPGKISGTGWAVRAGRTLSFFAGAAYGSTEAAESLCQTVRALHGQVKGFRPDGKPYDADEPEFFRWTYATVVQGLAAAHERYHPRPLKGAALDQFYREYAVVGEALGGTDLPKTKAECRYVLNNSPSVVGVTINADNIDYVRMIPRGLRGGFFGWLIQDILPEPIQKVLDFRQPNPALLRVYKALGRGVAILINSMGDIHEVDQALHRVGRTKKSIYRGTPRITAEGEPIKIG
ncbi:MAG: oxygenase MpaB family protein [Segniliparus sp.]|uniref:oxygenase MpaB family protein n=1 Tax=Segniliparus sp. TaxID=2804064 RepID=UPI003F34C123